MTEHRLTRAVTAGSALVVAVCVAVLTVRVMVSGFPLTVEHLRTYEREDLTERVRIVLSDRGALAGESSVSCPSGVTIRTGVEFTCDITLNGEPMVVAVTITDADAGALEVGDVQSR